VLLVLSRWSNIWVQANLISLKASCCCLFFLLVSIRSTFLIDCFERIARLLLLFFDSDRPFRFLTLPAIVFSCFCDLHKKAIETVRKTKKKLPAESSRAPVFGMLNDVLAFASTCAALCCELCPQGSYGLIYISFTKKQKLGAIRHERQTSAAYFHEHKKGNLPSQPGAPKTCSPEDNVFREADTKRKIDVKELRSIGLNETHKARRRRR
jgi:hypothetical protein